MLKGKLGIRIYPFWNKAPSELISILTLAVLLGVAGEAFAEPFHVWEKVEIVLSAEKTYENPYTEVEVWVDLQGPGFEKRCYGFWDGGDTFRVRVLGNAVGEWSWTSGSNQDDPGLNGKTDEFTAVGWSEAEKQRNPSRRGMIQASANGHAFEYADGEPFFLLGDTWWATPTFRYRWDDDDRPRLMGPEAGFKDYVRFRKDQGFNCVAMIAALPNWANDGQPGGWDMADGTVLRRAWPHGDTNFAQDMHDEDGNRAFLFPGKVPGYEAHFPDVERINPAYFRNLDRKIDYLNEQGFVPFIESARRDIGQAWKKFYPWPSSYTRYIQYIWSRYQANICLFSPIHFDTPGSSIPAEDWNNAANLVIERYGPPPFGTLAGTNSNPSSLRNFGHVDKAKWLMFHQIGNRRTHQCYTYLTEIFQHAPPVPGFNGEPYYDGMEDAPGGSDLAALYCRSAMYGSVLSGGLAGHIYGVGGWEGGMWQGDVEEGAPTPMWDAVKWPSAAQLRHLRTFVLSQEEKYQALVPRTDLLSPNKTVEDDGFLGWAYCARTDAQDLFLIYFEQGCDRARLSGAIPDGSYEASWFNPRNGEWTDAGTLVADDQGEIALPRFPGNRERSDTDWAMKLTLAGG